MIVYGFAIEMKSNAITHRYIYVYGDFFFIIKINSWLPYLFVVAFIYVSWQKFFWLFIVSDFNVNDVWKQNDLRKKIHTAFDTHTKHSETWYETAYFLHKKNLVYVLFCPKITICRKNSTLLLLLLLLCVVMLAV